MFRSPLEPSPFVSTRCPYDTQAHCRRPYCPFSHRTAIDDLFEDSPRDVILLDDNSDRLSEDAPSPASTAATEIRQENPLDQFSGGYVGFVSTTKQQQQQQILQQHQQLQHQQNGLQPIFFPNLPPSHQHQSALCAAAALPQFVPLQQTSAPFFPSQYPFVHHQYDIDAMPYQQPNPFATTVSASHFFTPIQPPPRATKQQQSKHIHHHHHKKQKLGPRGLPAYIPTPIAQLEKEQKEREQRREERRKTKKEPQKQQAEKEEEGIRDYLEILGEKKQSNGGEKTQQKQKPKEENIKQRLESVGTKEGIEVKKKEIVLKKKLHGEKKQSNEKEKKGQQTLKVDNNKERRENVVEKKQSNEGKEKKKLQKKGENNIRREQPEIIVVKHNKITVKTKKTAAHEGVENGKKDKWQTEPTEKAKKLTAHSLKLNNATVLAPSTSICTPASNYVPVRIPMHHPSQRPAAPKPFTTSSTIGKTVAASHLPSLSSSTTPRILPSVVVTNGCRGGGVGGGAVPSSSSTCVTAPPPPPPPQRKLSTAAGAGAAANTPTTTTPTTKLSTVGKGVVRKAHVPKFMTANQPPSKLLAPLEPTNRKVPFQLRQRQLFNIHAEYVKLCGDDDPLRAIEGAQNEEKTVLDRCISKMGYLAAIPMLIKRLREAAANGHHGGHNEGEIHRKNSVSHISVLLGRHANTVTCGLHRADRTTTAQHTILNETDFYNALQAEYLLTDQQMWDNGYPRWAAGPSAAANDAEQMMMDEDAWMDIDESSSAAGGKTLVEIRQSELDAGKSRIPFVDDSVLCRVCDRCGKEYRLTREGDYAPGASSDQCIFHWGRAWKKRVSGTIETRYNCCDQPLTVQGCDVAPHHITQTQRLSTLRRYAETPRPYSTEDPRSKKLYALDCEMVYTVWGPEVARLSVVDFAGALVLDLIIRPEQRIVDCNTKFSGLKPEQVLAGECDLNEARHRFFELANAETILIGHSLESDLRAMRLIHRRIVDTSVIFPHRMGPPFKRALKTLASEITQMIIQDDESGHDSKEDALACMRIMLRKCRGGGGTGP